MSKIINFEINETGSEKLTQFILERGKEGLNLQACVLEALASFESDVSTGSAPTWELGGQFTQSGRPEVFSLTQGDCTVTEENDDD